MKAIISITAILGCTLLSSCGNAQPEPHPVREEAYVLADSVREAQYAEFAEGISERYPNRPVTADQVREALTAPTWTAPDGREYIVQTGAKGGHYVLRTSKKTGRQYKVYLRRHDDGSFSTYR